MTALVADASVIVKCVLEEPGSAVALDLVASAFPLLSPESALSESANAIWKAAHRQLISHGDSAAALADVLAMPLLLLSLKPLSPAALGLAVAFDHPVYDCYYLAAAVQNECPLATADTRLYDLAQTVGLGERAILVR